MRNKGEVGSTGGKLCRKRRLKKRKSCECNMESQYGALGKMITYLISGVGELK